MLRYITTKIELLALVPVLLLSLSTYSQNPSSIPEPKPLRCSDCYNLNAKILVSAKPNYPAAALAVGASGKVDVSIEIDSGGNVIFAKPTTGNQLLWAASTKAAMKIKFEPVLIGGTPVGGYGQITFNFVPRDRITVDKKPVLPETSKQSVLNESKRIHKLPIVNGLASYLPKPVYPKLPIDVCASGQVSVQVLIGKNGRVKQAETISGNRLLRNSAIKAAKRARFSQNVDAPPIEHLGIVIYNFPPSKGCRK